MTISIKRLCCDHTLDGLDARKVVYVIVATSRPDMNEPAMVREGGDCQDIVQARANGLQVEGIVGDIS